MNKGFSIAIDGPVAAGKGTVSSFLAKTLKGFYLDTGIMYRCVALFCIINNIDIAKENEVVSALSKINIEFKNNKIYLNKVKVDKRIREADVASKSSVVAAYEQIRSEMVKKQQEIANSYIQNGKIVVADGRDVGTVVLPNARIKIFLTSDVNIRAQRSLKRYRKKGFNISFEDVLAEIKERDYRDTHRQVGPLPLKPEQFGYWILDNSKQTEVETTGIILSELKDRGLIT